MRRYPRRPKGHLGIRRAERLCSFSRSASAALLGSFFSVRAGNVPFLKRDPHDQTDHTLMRFKKLNCYDSVYPAEFIRDLKS